MRLKCISKMQIHVKVFSSEKPVYQILDVELTVIWICNNLTPCTYKEPSSSFILEISISPMLSQGLVFILIWSPSTRKWNFVPCKLGNVWNWVNISSNPDSVCSANAVGLWKRKSSRSSLWTTDARMTFISSKNIIAQQNWGCLIIRSRHDRPTIFSTFVFRAPGHRNGVPRQDTESSIGDARVEASEETGSVPI